MLRKCAVTLRPFGARAFSSEVSPQRAALVELAKAHRLSVPLIGAIFPAALAYIGEKIPGFLSSHTENSEHHFTKEDIEFGALYAFENILLSIAEGDSTHLTKVCHESIRPALSGVCKLVADGTLPVTLTYDEMIRPKARIIQAYAADMEDSHFLVFVARVSSPFKLEAKVGNSNVPLHEIMRNVQIGRRFSISEEMFLENHWQLTSDLRFEN
eukprot:c5682_g1_i1.p1 GENE.c5682_g1_i1~~c5682_g1_i1.p1  ORF type:complete len:213 (+),score=54.07 c5682_g1_i1:39-677(+)